MQHGDASVTTWTTMIQAYIINGQLHEAIHHLQRMRDKGIEPNDYTFSVVLNVIADMTNLQEGKRIHTLLNVPFSFSFSLSFSSPSLSLSIALILLNFLGKIWKYK